MAEIWGFAIVRSELLWYALLGSSCFLALPQKIYYSKGREIKWASKDITL